EGEVQRRRRQERLADDVEAEERGGAVEVHGREHEEPRGRAEDEQRAREGCARAEHPRHQTRGNEDCTAQQEGREEQHPVAYGEALTLDRDLALDVALTQSIPHCG